ncbi:MAG TPA: hypothetical protein VFV54_08780 [Thermoanaerobaculia bacterium]|nr:hypothetical protein [Thermoanaerobaculia bacterium]
MTSVFVGLMALFFGFVILMAVIAVLRRRVGGGFGPTEMSDGSMTTTPTGYPEGQHGSGKTITPAENDAAKY